jgi:hypothetical protein
MDPISTIKDISALVKKYNDLELMKQIIDLQNEVFELQQVRPSVGLTWDHRPWQPTTTGVIPTHPALAGEWRDLLSCAPRHCLRAC